MNYATIKRNYQRGLWPAATVRLAARKGVITHAQAEEIIASKGNSNDIR